MSGDPQREAIEQGRTASPRELADRLSGADPSYLEGALQNPGLDEDLVLALLRNRGAPSALLRRLARDARFRRAYEIRLGLVRHPHTPRGIAMDLAHHLYWRDLARTADDPRVPPVVRRTAVKLLESRLEDLALGEQVALARSAGRGVALVLRRTRREPVVRALLDNPRMVEDDLIAISASRDTPGEILGLVARSDRWMRRHRVRVALVQNPRTPIGVALAALPGLLRRDLEGIAGSRDRPRLLRLGAARVLQRRGIAVPAGRTAVADEPYLLDAEEE